MSYIIHHDISNDVFKNEVFIFGYGSLMYPKGINSRGMEIIYRSDMFEMAKIKSFKRGAYATYAGRYYYSLAPAGADSYTNGVVFRIYTKDDMDILLKDEGAHFVYDHTSEGRMYDVADVTELVCDVWLPEKAKVFTLINPYHKENKEGVMDPWYIEHVWDGIQMHGEEFVIEFLKTGGVAADGGSKCLTSISSKV